MMAPFFNGELTLTRLYILHSGVLRRLWQLSNGQGLPIQGSTPPPVTLTQLLLLLPEITLILTPLPITMAVHTIQP